MEHESLPRKPTGDDVTDRRSLLVLQVIMGAVLVWGALHAVGAFLFNWDWRKPLIILACVAVFLGGWLLLLRSRRRHQ